MSWPWVFSTLPAGNVAASKLDDNFNAAAELASPAFTGTPTAPNPAAQALNNSQIANTAYVDRVAVQQIVKTVTGAVATGTTTVPFDDTIPQNTEGDEYMSQAITPKSATSTLRIDVVFNGANSGGQTLIVSLFQDSTVNALATVAQTAGSTDYNIQVSFTYFMTSGTTSATTFKVRAGSNIAGTTTFNGVSGGRLFGGVCASSLTITEIGV